MASRKRYSYSFPRPAVTVDVTVFAAELRKSGGPADLRVLLIRRGKDPFAKRWALPGGFVDEHEDLPVAARRELVEETGLHAALGPQLGTYGTPGRDPRGHTVSVVYLVWLPGGPAPVQGLDDAIDARWHSARRPPTLAFDHREVLRDGVREIANLCAPDRRDAPFLTLLPRTFTAGEATLLLGAARGEPVTPSFRSSVRRALRRSPTLRELAPSGREPRFRKN